MTDPWNKSDPWVMRMTAFGVDQGIFYAVMNDGSLWQATYDSESSSYVWAELSQKNVPGSAGDGT